MSPRYQFISSGTELKNIVPVNHDFNVADIGLYFQRSVEGFITPFLGSEMLDELELQFNNNKITPDNLLLINYIKPVQGFFGMMDYQPYLDVHISDLGISMRETADLKPAYKGKIFQLRKQLFADGYKSMDRLVDYVHANAAKYPTYEGSSAFSTWHKHYVNTKAEFNVYEDILDNSWLLEKLKPRQIWIEEDYVVPVIGEETNAFLKAAILSQSSLGAYAPLLPFIQKIIVTGCMVEAFETLGVKLENEGLTIFSNEFSRDTIDNKKNPSLAQQDRMVKTYTKKLNAAVCSLDKHIRKNKDDYALYLDNTYTDQSESEYENDPNSGFFFGG